MAIAPIDLQTLYSQLENVSKTVVHQQQGVQLSNAIQQETNARQVAEKNTAVQQLKNENTDVISVRDRKASKDDKGRSEGKNNKQENQDQAENQTSCRFEDPNLGRYVDISG